MRFQESPLPGVWVIDLEPIADERGWFVRSFDAEELRVRGLHAKIVQGNVSFNPRRGTIRGMHYQAEPHGEAKLVRSARGASFHVVVDLRPDSPTYCGWHGVELSGRNHRALYVPPGLAHGFQAMEDECEVLYQMGHEYVPSAARGVRWDDPAFAIEWPPVVGGVQLISARDRAFADYEPMSAAAVTRSGTAAVTGSRSST